MLPISWNASLTKILTCHLWAFTFHLVAEQIRERTTAIEHEAVEEKR
jgi:hypothetical protein